MLSPDEFIKDAIKKVKDEISYTRRAPIAPL